MRCSYCEDKNYKKKYTKPPDCIGGYIDGYWFCKWCLEYGFKNDTSSEKERIRKLSSVAESKNYATKSMLDS
jgi:hypothetical protein